MNRGDSRSAELDGYSFSVGKKSRADSTTLSPARPRRLFLGARTMKYPDFLDIRIALTGRVLLPDPISTSTARQGFAFRFRTSKTLYGNLQHEIEGDPRAALCNSMPIRLFSHVPEVGNAVAVHVA